MSREHCERVFLDTRYFETVTTISRELTNRLKKPLGIWFVIGLVIVAPLLHYFLNHAFFICIFVRKITRLFLH